MDRQITGFHQDEQGVWVAELECGHQQHVRHDPPWQVRPWVLEPSTRQGRVGTILPCSICDAEKYEDARIQGLCHDGATEVSRKKPLA
ncbi:MAG: DUF3565 domain-containing protein [Gemmatimonadota bacterium]